MSPATETPPSPESASPYAGLAQKIRPQGSAALKKHLSQDPVVVVVRSNESRSMRGLFLATLNLYRLAVTSLPFNVVLNGKVVAKLSAGEHFETTLAPGDHKLWVSNTLGASRATSFTVDCGQRIRFACHGKLFGLMTRRIE